MVDTRFSISIQIMTTLAFHQGELLNSDDLAQVLKTNPTFIRRILSKLIAAELIESFRGKNGGVKFTKDPSSVSLKDIYLASMEDKPFVSAHDKPATKDCKVSCSMGQIFQGIVRGMENGTLSYLEGHSLKDIVSKIQA